MLQPPRQRSWCGVGYGSSIYFGDIFDRCGTSLKNGDKILLAVQEPDNGCRTAVGGHRLPDNGQQTTDSGQQLPKNRQQKVKALIKGKTGYNKSYTYLHLFVLIYIEDIAKNKIKY